MGNGSLNGAIVNQSDKKICYTISSEKLYLEATTITKEIGGSLEIGFQHYPSGKASINGNHKSTTDFKGKQIQSLVAVKSNCSSSIGLEQLENNKVRINLWVGDQKQIEQLLLRDVQVKTEKDIRHIVNFKFQICKLEDEDYEKIQEGKKLEGKEYQLWQKQKRKIMIKKDQCPNSHKLTKFDSNEYPYKKGKKKQCSQCGISHYKMEQQNEKCCEKCFYIICENCLDQMTR